MLFAFKREGDNQSKEKKLGAEKLPGTKEITSGLTSREVAERVASGKTNRVRERSSRSYWHIFRANVFTRFNAILGALFVLILIFGSPKDGLFGLVLLANTAIGIIQEIRAKRALDRLSIVAKAPAKVIRDGRRVELPPEEIVLDDLIEIRTGDQMVVDGVVVDSSSLEIDESLLTGESMPVAKSEGDKVFSGSFVISGAGAIRAIGVGDDAYARRLASEAKRFSLATSELREGINLILRYITWFMIPAGFLLFSAQVKTFGYFGKAVPGTVAGLVGMVPEGFVLLTSVSFAVSVITLSRSNVLVSDLAAVEGLARVDVICLDKTGTLTDGKISFKQIEKFGESKKLDEVLASFANDPSSSSSTLVALKEAFPLGKGRKIVSSVPFSSERKWSAGTFEGLGTWVMGAPEILIEKIARKDIGEIRRRVEELAHKGMRVVMLASAGNEVKGEELPRELEPAALLIFEENVRPDAADTIKYFESQGVSVRVISGDDPRTVLTVALRAGVSVRGEPVDARALPKGGNKLSSIMDEHTVFGRVTPEGKREMVEALKASGHTVAMTGDGVNDVLALKKSDIGIAMGSGSPATRAVAEIVLADGRFRTLPDVVREGRRVIGNMERVANLFLVKTVYATLLSIATGIFGWAFIFLPRHLTLVSSLTIGIPALLLSFGRGSERYRPGFVSRVFRFAIPAGTVAAISAFSAGAISHFHPWVSLDESRTIATMVLVIIALWALAVLISPLDILRGALVAALSAAFMLVFLIPPLREIFALKMPGSLMLFETAVIAAAGIFLLHVGWKLFGWHAQGRKELGNV